MPRRFTDTEKWRDEWWGSLSNDNRMIWLYLVDSCSIAGIWKKDFRGLNFNCNTKISEEEFLQVFGERLIDRGNYFFIPKFLRFQCPKGLNSNKPAILSIIKEIQQNNLTEIIQQSLGNDFLIIKGKGKGKGKDKEEENEQEDETDTSKSEDSHEPEKISLGDEIIDLISEIRKQHAPKSIKLAVTRSRTAMVLKRQQDFKNVWPERDFKAACKFAFEYKAREWVAKEGMWEYFMPETLLTGKNFIKYIEEALNKKSTPSTNNQNEQPKIDSPFSKRKIHA